MDSSSMTTNQILFYSAILTFGVSIVVGLVPLIVGIRKKNLKFGILGFVLTIVGAALLGFILSVPVAAIFTWMIVRGEKPPANPPAAAA